MAHISDIKLIRTDTTLILAKRPRKVWVEREPCALFYSSLDRLTLLELAMWYYPGNQRRGAELRRSAALRLPAAWASVFPQGPT